MQKTAIIVPCYNESRRLSAPKFIKYAKENKDVHFIFINDGSTDDTQVVINEICSLNYEQTVSIIQKRNCGKAEAVRQGFLKAIEMDFENIGYFDADLSTPLDFICKFCELLDSNRITIVMGARVKLLGRRIERRAIRHYLGRIFATCASFVLGISVYDTQCGAKIFKNNYELKRVFSIPFTVKWIFDVEILARFKIIKKYSGNASLEESAIEYPLEVWTHISGSKIKISDFFVSALEIFKIYLLLYFPGIAKNYSKKLFFNPKTSFTI